MGQVGFSEHASKSNGAPKGTLLCPPRTPFRWCGAERGQPGERRDAGGPGRHHDDLHPRSEPRPGRPAEPGRPAVRFLIRPAASQLKSAKIRAGREGFFELKPFGLRGRASPELLEPFLQRLESASPSRPAIFECVPALARSPPVSPSSPEPPLLQPASAALAWKIREK